MPRARYPSSPNQRLLAGEVRSQSLSRVRVMPKASLRRPGPLVSLGKFCGPDNSIPLARAISSMPESGSSARKRTHPALPSRSQETLRQ